MSAPIIPATSKIAWSHLLGYTMIGGNITQALAAARVHLWTGFVVPALGITNANLIELAVPGYSAQALAGPVTYSVDWQGNGLVTFKTVNFTGFTGGLPCNALGFFVDYLDPVTGLTALLWAQQWDSPFVWLNSGNNYPLVPQLRASQC
jgi:hypothetical protein